MFKSWILVGGSSYVCSSCRSSLEDLCSNHRSAEIYVQIIDSCWRSMLMQIIDPRWRINVQIINPCCRIYVQIIDPRWRSDSMFKS